MTQPTATPQTRRPIPPLLYGTAWKEAHTESLTLQALTAGFRGIDTANQRKHYHEAGVGRAVQAWLAQGHDRDELFLQTKYTFVRGQDHRLPYDPSAPIAAQVAQSVRSSCEHLGVDHLDSYVLHGPSRRTGLGAPDREAWRAMEGLVDEGLVGVLGVSNVSAGQVQRLLDFARVAPVFVQNRCYAERGWDAEVRALCERRGLVYQGFSLLTANRHVVGHRQVRAIASALGCTPQQVVFRFAMDLGILPLTGTSDPTHMRQDLAVVELELSDAQRAQIAAL